MSTSKNGLGHLEIKYTYMTFGHKIAKRSIAFHMIQYSSMRHLSRDDSQTRRKCIHINPNERGNMRGLKLSP